MAKTQITLEACFILLLVCAGMLVVGEMGVLIKNQFSLSLIIVLLPIISVTLFAFRIEKFRSKHREHKGGHYAD